MNRHLLPDEFDLLVDAESGLESGFGVAPLRAHVRECATCRAELEQAEALAATLDVLPHFAPSVGFADRVMADVQVFEPWHVALADTVRRLVPASPPLRALAAGGVLAMGTLLTTVTLWVLARADVLAFTTDAAAAHLRGVLWDGLRGFVTALAGTPATSAGALAAALGMLVVAFALAGTGLRAAAAASRRIESPSSEP
ncbi:hypothetical protein tb265_04330 [Gemmatimonadetes bacterium T265]|nr:hypothetical protein tb265_04330 [Gemmatimonadetes bacterium T265]